MPAIWYYRKYKCFRLFCHIAAITNQQLNWNIYRCCGSNISHLVHTDYVKQQCTYSILPKAFYHLRIPITLPFHKSSLNNHIMGMFFFLLYDIRIPLFVSLCLRRTQCFLSLNRTDSDVKMHHREAIHSWLAMAPTREHTPHNNELFRLPEDTMPVQRIEIKTQVRCEGYGWGRGGGNGGYEFNIQQMLNILHPGIHVGIIDSIQMLNHM